MTTSASESGNAVPQARGKHWLTSWKLWLFLLIVGLLLMAVALVYPTYRRMLAIRYLNDHEVSIEFAAGGEWATEWFGELGMGLYTVNSISCFSELNDTVLRHMAALGEVKELVCDTPGEHQLLTEAGFTALQSLTQLEFLVIYGKLEVVGDQDLFAGLFAARPPLITVELSDTPMSAAAFAELTQIESLKVLQVSVNNLSSVRNLHPLPNLTNLVLTHDEPFDVSWLQTCPRLDTLHLFGPLCDDDLRQIAELKNVAFLIFGIDRDIEVTEAGVAHLAKLTSLEQISLPADLFTPATVEVLRQLPALRAVWLDRQLEDRSVLEVVPGHWMIIEPSSHR